MSTRENDHDRIELLQGTLDILILKILLLGTEHGQGIARAIQDTSNDTLLVEHGSLYPALQRLEEKGWIKGKWGVSASNRRARFYELTRAGRRQVEVEADRWRRFVAAMGLVLGIERSQR